MQSVNELAVETVVISTANKSMATGALTSLLGFFASINWLSLTGSLVAIIGLFANIYFQKRRDRREAEESKARIKALGEHCGL